MSSSSDVPNASQGASNPAAEQAANVPPPSAEDVLSYNPLAKTSAYTGTASEADTAIAQAGAEIGWMDAAGTWFGAAIGALSPAMIGLLILAGIASVGGVYFAYRLYQNHVTSQEALQAAAELAQNGLSDDNRDAVNTVVKAIGVPTETGVSVTTPTGTGITTTPGREGFTVHWTDYPAQGDEARPVVISFRFDPADGRNVDISNSSPISDGGKSGIPSPPISGVPVGTKLPNSDFVEAPPGDYSVSVVVDVAYSPVPWGPNNKLTFIDQPMRTKEGYTAYLSQFHAKVLRGRTTDLSPRYSHIPVPPPEDRMWTCEYRAPFKGQPARASILMPLNVSQAAADADNRNNSGPLSDGGPPYQVLELRYKRLYLGFDMWHDTEVPPCSPNGSGAK